MIHAISPRGQARSPEERRVRNKQLELLRNRGVQQLVDNGPMVEHIKWLETWLTHAEIARRADVTESTMCGHLTRRHGKVYAKIANAVLAVRPTPEDLTREERKRGAVRIIRGLTAKGYSYNSIGRAVGLSGRSLANFMCKNNAFPTLSPEWYRELIRVAQKLEAEDPAIHGDTKTGISINKSRARKNTWPPITAWDLDRVHLEDEEPEWTGSCGTPAGYQSHRKHGILPACQRCVKAHTAYTREQKERERASGREEILSAVREACLNGGKYREIAKEHGVSLRTISRMRRELGLRD